MCGKGAETTCTDCKIRHLVVLGLRELSVFNERKLVLGLQHVKVKVKVKVKVQTEKFRNIGVLR